MSFKDEIAKLLGVKINVPFRIIGDNNISYRINDRGLTDMKRDGLYERWYPSNMVLIQLLEGLIEIDWTPDTGDTYFYPHETGIERGIWEGSDLDFNRKKLTNIYKDKDRAEKKWKMIWGKNGRR